MKRTLILVILALCLVVSACAETAAVTSVMGEVNGDTYENTALGFGCKLEGWHYFSEEEIAAANQVARGQMDEQLQKMLEAAQPISVMTAQSADNTLNITVQAQDIGSSLAAFEALGMKALAENSISLYKQSLENSGLTDVELSVGEAVIGEETVTCLDGSYKMNGIPMCFRQPWLIKGNYMATITLTSLATDRSDEILPNFYLIP